MPLERQQTGGFRLGQELLVQGLVFQLERHVHAGAAGRVHLVAVEAGVVEVAVEEVGLRLVARLHRLQPALFFEPLEHQAGQIPGVGGGSVEHGVVLGGELVVKDRGHVGSRLVQQVVPHYGDGQTRRAYVLLGTGVEDAEAAHVDGTGEDGGGEIRHQGHIAGGRDVEHLYAIYGFVRAVVHIGRIGAKRRGRQQVAYPLLVLRHPLEGLDVPVFLGLIHGALGPDAGHQVIRLLVGATQQVHGHGRELAATAAVHEEHLVVVRYRQQIAQIRFGLLGDRHIGLAAMGQLHDRGSQPLEITKFALGALHDFNRQHGGAGAEVVNLFAHDAFREWMRVIDDLNVFTRQAPVGAKAFWDLAQPFAPMADADTMEKALNGPGLAENMHGNGGETAQTAFCAPFWQIYSLAVSSGSRVKRSPTRP